MKRSRTVRTASSSSRSTEPTSFTKNTVPQLYTLITEAEAAYESSGEVCQFSSKYDASKYGVPPQNRYTLSASEERGRQLYFGIGTKNAHCAECHSSSAFPPVLATTNGKDTFTMYCFANIGVPKNFANPFYQETDCTSNPHGCNPLGTNFIDYGLGGNPNPAPDGTVFNNPATNSQFLGLFQAPTMRNVDLRPSPTFVKAYFHNGWAKSLETVVHFYNKRNIAVNAQGQEVVFDLTTGPPAGYTPLFSPPEVLTNVNNVQGMQSNVPGQAQVGNLGLSASEEARPGQLHEDPQRRVHQAQSGTVGARPGRLPVNPKQRVQAAVPNPVGPPKP